MARQDSFRSQISTVHFYMQIDPDKDPHMDFIDESLFGAMLTDVGTRR